MSNDYTAKKIIIKDGDGNYCIPYTDKQDPITGAASTVTSSNLNTNRVLISNNDGKIADSDVTSTELSYLDGVTSNIQTQLGNKQDTLVSGTNIKTINSTSILGEGDIVIKSAPDLDNKTITKNDSEELQSVGVINKNKGGVKYDWVGTLAEYNALDSYNDDWIYYITDDCNQKIIANENRITRAVYTTPITCLFSVDTSTNTLTIKTGSRVHYPNGKNEDGDLLVNDYTFESDVTYSPTDLTANEFVVYNITKNQFEHIAINKTYTSSDGTTTLETCLAYIENTNYIRKTSDTGTTWSDDIYSFPMCIVSNTSGKIKDVIQSFQGSTYLGKTIYFEREYKVRIPNGFDETTGEPRFIETELTMNRLCKMTGNFSLYIEVEENDPTTQYVSQCNNALIYEQEIMPTYRYTMLWYNPRTNYWYYTQDGGDTWSKVFITYLTHVNQFGDSNYISCFNPIATATTLTTNDMRLVTHWAYPSRWKTVITPTSGSMYTAPADGYFYLSVTRADSAIDAYAMITGYETNYVVSSCCPNNSDDSSSTAGVIMPVSSGTSVVMNFSGTVSTCGFYYCNGGFIA